jgi:hypothetical protein
MQLPEDPHGRPTIAWTATAHAGIEELAQTQTPPSSFTVGQAEESSVGAQRGGAVGST